VLCVEDFGSFDEEPICSTDEGLEVFLESSLEELAGLHPESPSLIAGFADSKLQFRDLDPWAVDFHSP
jgi:hypothetical protein